MNRLANASIDIDMWRSRVARETLGPPEIHSRVAAQGRSKCFHSLGSRHLWPEIFS